jgi:hypothetical protein
MEARMRATIVALFLVAVPSIAWSAAPDWSVYRAASHACRVDYASGLFTRDRWDEERGLQRFSGPGPETFFRVSGIDNDRGLSPRDLKARYLKADAPGEIVYERTKPEFLVLSGYRGDSIFYIKAAMSPDRRIICVLEIVYPRKDKRAFDAIVTRMSRSFKVAGD